ncbi:MAG TPA: hotdog fold thioesterase [Nannocystaceae bacterium]|nr:hotdog fold thioesterase [Nannocystaceae bacterium]
MEQPLADARRDLLRTIFEDGIPYNRFLGLRVELLERGRCVLRVPWRDELLGDTLRAAVHGGVTSMLVDTSGGAACFTMLDREEDRISTVDLRVDYLRPGTAGDLWCTAEIVRMGNRVGVARMEVFSGGLPGAGEPGRPIATGQAVYNVVRKSGGE